MYHFKIAKKKKKKNVLRKHSSDQNLKYHFPKGIFK